ncbi:docking protein 1b [Stigmatopora nigra]
MDTHIKEGQLYIQHQKFGKKWKKNWLVLYPASQNGIARLEFFDSHGSVGVGNSSVGNTNEKTRKLDKKIIRLSECISILPALTENCPKDNMAAFCVETNDKTHVFAAEKNAARDWMETMCDIAFQGGIGANGESDGGTQDLMMSENLIYYSREQTNEFWVSIQRTEASERCGLSGNYWLKAESNVLILKDPKTKRNVLVWPYKLLRRYGRDRVMFSFESGRRCDSGPGAFTFDTKQGNEIFTLVDQAIKSQKALAEERPLSCPIYFDPECPPSLQHVRSQVSGSGDSSSCSSWEADGDSAGSKPGSADGVLAKREGVGRGAERHKGRSLPELPGILGLAGGGNTPPRSPKAKRTSSADERAALYSEPADSIRLPSHLADRLYSDPVDSIASSPSTPRLRLPADEFQAGPRRKSQDLYSHVYDHISLKLSQKTAGLSLDGARIVGRPANAANANRPTLKGAPPLSQEHIYDEPEGRAMGVFSAAIYDEARLEPHSSKRLEDTTAPFGPEGNYSTAFQGKLTEFQKQFPAPRWPKPITAPKPSGFHFARKDPVQSPTSTHYEPLDNTNNNNNNNIGELYSKVCKPSKLQSHPSKPKPISSPDIIYDNLGSI